MIECEECGEEVPPSGDACPNCGVPLPPADEDTGSEGISRPWTIGVGILLTPIAAVLTYALIIYGTLVPCGILQQELMARTEAAAERGGKQGLLHEGAEALGLRIGEEALEAKLADTSQLQCAELMWEMKTGSYGDVRRFVR